MLVPIIQIPRNPNPISAEEEARLWAEGSAAGRAKLNAATQLLKNGQWEAAEKTALEAKALLPSPGPYAFVLIQVNQVLAFIRIHAGRYQEALPLLEEIRPKGMNADPRSELMIALCYARLGQMDAARRCYANGNKGSQVLRIVFEGDAAQMARSLPSMASDRGVEANILFVLGFDLFYRSGRQEMLRYLESAAKAASYNSVLAF